MSFKFFTSKSFNMFSNTSRMSLDDLAQDGTLSRTEPDTLKLAPLSYFQYECTIEKEIASDGSTIIYNQVYDDVKKVFYDVISTVEKANVITYKLRLRTIDGVYQHIEGNNFNLKRHSNYAVDIVNKSFPKTHLDATSNDVTCQISSTKSDMQNDSAGLDAPLIIVCFWTSAAADDTFAFDLNRVIGGNTTDVNYVLSRLNSTRCYFTIAYPYIDEEGKLTYTSGNCTLNGTPMCYITELNTHVDGLPNEQIQGTTFGLLWDYSKEKSLNTYNYTLNNFIMSSGDNNGLRDAGIVNIDNSTNKAGILYKSTRQAQFAVSDILKSKSQAHKTGNTLNLNILGQSAVIDIDEDASQTIAINQTLMPQGTTITVMSSEKQLYTGITLNNPKTSMLLSLDINGGPLYDVSAMEQYQKDNPNAYALAVKVPSQNIEFTRQQAFNDNLYNSTKKAAKGVLGSITSFASGNVGGGLSGLMNAGEAIADGIYQNNKLNDTADFQKSQLQETFALQQGNIAAQKGSVSTTNNFFASILVGLLSPVLVNVDCQSPGNQKLTNEYYKRYGYAVCTREPLKITSTPCYVQCQSAMLDIVKGDRGIIDARFIDIANQLEKGVLFI